MIEKNFKNLDEQIEIFKHKGLIIKDEHYAKQILLRENYFFLNGYRHLFMQNARDDKYIDGTTFDELYGVFTFDRRIRNIFFKNILVIENNIKSIMSYQLSKKYGFKDRDYLNPKNFNQDPLKSRQVKDVLNKMKRQIRVNGSQHAATYHYIANYGYVPLWILVKVLSFGLISELYGILKTEDQLKIANMYKTDIDTLCTYLCILANYRNICAHEEVLYEHKTQRTLNDYRIHQKLNIEKIDGQYKYGVNDMFAVIIILKNMLSESEFTDFINEISYEVDVLQGKIHTVSINSILNTCGFPDNWRDIMEI